MIITGLNIILGPNLNIIGLSCYSRPTPLAMPYCFPQYFTHLKPLIYILFSMRCSRPSRLLGAFWSFRFHGSRCKTYHLSVICNFLFIGAICILRSLISAGKTQAGVLKRGMALGSCLLGLSWLLVYLQGTRVMTFPLTVP